MIREMLSQIVCGSVLRIELTQGLHVGISALETTILDTHNRDGEFIVTMWLRPLFEETCELVLDQLANEWKLFVRVGQTLYAFPVTSVTVLEEGVTDKDDFGIAL